MKKFKKYVAAVLAAVMLVCSMTALLTACAQNKQQTPTPPNPAEPVYTMSFYVGNSGAAEIDPIKGKAGSSISKPNDPLATGYTFAGWYEDYGTWQKPYNDFSAMPAKNIVLYAKWDELGDEIKDEIEAELNANSKEGHLYIHYMRFSNVAEEYEKYNLWVWPKEQTGVEFDWIRDENGQIKVDPVLGATCDIDLTVTYDKAGNKKDTTTTFLKNVDTNYKEGDIFKKDSYTDDSIGFLIVDEKSKATALELGGHWTSDGGNQYIPKASEMGKVFADNVRDNGSLHIFVTQEHVYDYVYSLSEVKEAVDPYEGDDGTNVSLSNVNSSAVSTYGVSESAQGVSGVGYQIMVSSFADGNGDGKGDIRGIIENLDYLEKLNVDILWLTPIQLSDSYHGYDIIDYKEVDPKFGTMADYQELLNKAHAKGMKVIMDLVLNHTSVNNVWFQKSAQLDPEYRSYYQWKNHNNETLSESWHAYGSHAYSYYGKFATSMPELNYDYQGTRDAIVDVADFWLSKGVDGFRIDAVKHIYMEDEVNKESTDIIISDYDEETKTDYSSNVTKNLNFFLEFNGRIKAKYPNAYIVGENFDGNAYNVAPYYKGLDSMLNFYAYYNFAQILDGKAGNAQQYSGIGASSDGSRPSGDNTGSLYTGTWSYEGTLATYSKYREDEQAIDTVFTSNHDIPRLLNNVVGGESSSDWFGKNVTASNAAVALKRAKVVFSTMMCLPGISFIYYGDEIGMSGNFGPGETKTSPHIDRQYRQPFKWTTKDYDEGGSQYITHFGISGDTTYAVEWDAYNITLPGVAEQEQDPNSMLNYCKKFTALKSNDNVIKYGKYQSVQSQSGVFAYKLTYQGVTYYCYHNFTQYAVGNYHRGGNTVVLSVGGDKNSLPAYSSIIFKA